MSYSEVEPIIVEPSSVILSLDDIFTLFESKDKAKSFVGYNTVELLGFSWILLAFPRQLLTPNI
jgi:hypothetical protein